MRWGVYFYFILRAKECDRPTVRELQQGSQAVGMHGSPQRESTNSPEQWARKIEIETNSGIPFSKYQTTNRRRKSWVGVFSASVQSSGSLEGTHESTGQDGPGEKLKEQAWAADVSNPPTAPYGRKQTEAWCSCSRQVHLLGRCCFYVCCQSHQVWGLKPLWGGVALALHF